jgi:thiamine-monophosphate kinase
MAGEFDLIRDYFQGATPTRTDVVLGIGDDCALLEVPPGRQLAVSMDTLVSGRHFVPDTEPEALGHKALAVNLSDLAAMGAEPAWVTLSLTLPAADEHWQRWLAAFMRGFAGLAAQHRVQLVGGDTTRGALSITLQVHGFVQPGQALRRDGAREGDLVYVSGQLGDAGLALLAQQGLYVGLGRLERLLERLHRPQPRVTLGSSLVGFASAAIDVSDGLAADLGHVCSASGCGALVYPDRLPLSGPVADYVRETGDWSVPLSSGDDYELVFTVPEKQQGELEAAAAAWDVPLTWIGWMRRGTGVDVQLPDGQTTDTVPGGYDHFGN